MADEKAPTVFAPSPQPAYRIIDHTYDTVVVGAGGSGLRDVHAQIQRES